MRPERGGRKQKRRRLKQQQGLGDVEMEDVEVRRPSYLGPSQMVFCLCDLLSRLLGLVQSSAPCSTTSQGSCTMKNSLDADSFVCRTRLAQMTKSKKLMRLMQRSQ